MRSLFCRVSWEPVRRTLIVGAIAASASTGALIAAGHRVGSAMLPFAGIGAVAYGRVPTGASRPLVAAGVVVHLATTLLWSAAFIGLVDRTRIRPRSAAAIIGTGQLGLSWLVASSSGKGMATLLPLGDRLVVAAVLVGAMVAGMRFAPHRPWQEPPEPELRPL